MGRLVGRDGYGEVTVGQVIAAAGVSRKTFYEYFDDKLDCFLTAYRETTERLIEALARPVEGDLRQRTAHQLSRYLAALTADLLLARAFVVEVMGAGPRALEERERVNGRFAALVFAHVSNDPLVRRACIGGVNEVVTGALLAGQTRLEPLLPGLLAFVRGARSHPEDDAARRPSRRP